MAVPMPSATPISPPMSDSVTASTRNCARMSRVRAPTAMRRPISRVRSVTDTSMMFMMPMPPTSSDTEATAARSSVSTRLEASCAAITSARLRSEKSSSAPGCTRWRWRSSARTWISTAAGSTPSAALTQIVPIERFFAALAEPTTRRARGRERHQDHVVLVVSPSGSGPCVSSTPITVKGTRLMRMVWPTGSADAEELPRHGRAEQAHLGAPTRPRPARRRGPRRAPSGARRGTRR